MLRGRRGPEENVSRLRHDQDPQRIVGQRCMARTGIQSNLKLLNKSQKGVLIFIVRVKMNFYCPNNRNYFNDAKSFFESKETFYLNLLNIFFSSNSEKCKKSGQMRIRSFDET